MRFTCKISNHLQILKECGTPMIRDKSRQKKNMVAMIIWYRLPSYSDELLFLYILIESLNNFVTIHNIFTFIWDFNINPSKSRTSNYIIKVFYFIAKFKSDRSYFIKSSKSLFENSSFKIGIPAYHKLIFFILNTPRFTKVWISFQDLQIF